MPPSASTSITIGRPGRQAALPAAGAVGEHGALAQGFDVMALWRERATRLEGRALECGHYLPEEKTEETAEAIEAFLTRDAAASDT